MSAVVFAAHNDDESLFCFYQLLRLRPHVVVCLRAARNHQQREAETEAAMAVAGRTWEQWDFPEDRFDWDALRREINRAANNFATVIAPAWETGGHEHHNAVADACAEIRPDVRYLTYRRGFGRSEGGIKIAPSLWERELKARALNCYVSQRQDERTSAWFPPGAYGTLDEWIIRP